MLSHAQKLAEYERLINEAWQILHAAGWDGNRYSAFTPAGAECLRLRSEALQLIRETLGENTHYYQRIAESLTTSTDTAEASNVPLWAETLQAAAEHYRRNAVFNDSGLADQLDNAAPDLAEVALNAAETEQAASMAINDITDTLQAAARETLVPAGNNPSPVALPIELAEAGSLPHGLARELSDALLTHAQPANPAPTPPDADTTRRLIQLARQLRRHLG